MDLSVGLGDSAREFGINLLCKGCGSNRSGVEVRVAPEEKSEQARGKRFLVGSMLLARDPLSGRWFAQAINPTPGFYFGLQKALDDGGGVVIIAGFTVVYLCSACNGNETMRQQLQEQVETEVLKPAVLEKARNCELLSQLQADLRRQLEGLERGIAVAKTELQQALERNCAQGAKVPAVL